MKIKCLLYGHKWKYWILHYMDSSFGQRCPSTDIYRICKKCRKIKRKSLYGAAYLTPKDLGLSKETKVYTYRDGKNEELKI